jgi:hypothetical protein
LFLIKEIILILSCNIEIIEIPILQDIQGRYPLKPLKLRRYNPRKLYLVYQQDIQGRYPLKPLKENTF